jgi:hypothetical protein
VGRLKPRGPGAVEPVVANEHVSVAPALAPEPQEGCTTVQKTAEGGGTAISARDEERPRGAHEALEIGVHRVPSGNPPLSNSGAGGEIGRNHPIQYHSYFSSGITAVETRPTGARL